MPAAKAPQAYLPLPLGLPLASDLPLPFGLPWPLPRASAQALQGVAALAVRRLFATSLAAPLLVFISKKRLDGFLVHRAIGQKDLVLQLVLAAFGARVPLFAAPRIRDPAETTSAKRRGVLHRKHSCLNERFHS